MRTTRVKLTAYKCEGVGTTTPLAIYASLMLRLRHIKQVGDEEVVNNYQLGLMNEAKKYGVIDFVKV